MAGKYLFSEACGSSEGHNCLHNDRLLCEGLHSQALKLFLCLGVYVKLLRLFGAGAYVFVCVSVCVSEADRGTLACPLSCPVSDCVAQRGPVLTGSGADSRGARGPVSVTNRGDGLFFVSLGPLRFAHWTRLSDVCGFTQQPCLE